MAQILVATFIVLAGSLSVVLVLTALRRSPVRPWVELGLAGVLLTNLGTTVPDLLDGRTEPAQWLLALAMASWLVVLFAYPDGRPAPGWTRWVLLAACVAVGGSLLPAVPGALLPAAFVPAFAVGVGSQVWRYRRRSTIRERQSTKWLLAGLIPATAVFLGIGLVVSTTSLDPQLLEDDWYLWVSLGAIWLVPTSGVIGLFVGDRGNIDEWIRAAIVTCGVGLVVGWAYFLAVPAVGPTWSAFGAAVLVIPVRKLVGRAATTIVYGRNAASTVSMLGHRLETTIQSEDVAGVVATTIADGLSLSYAAVVLGGDVAAEIGGPPPPTSPATVESFPVTYLGDDVGELRVAPRAGDVVLTVRDRTALARLAVAAGPALHGTRTLQELSIARERLVVAREEERRRLRRDLHDDLAPTLAGLGLRAAAAASIGSRRATSVSRLDADLQAGIQAAIAQVREIAHDLRPPILDDHGLEAAIRARLATEIDPSLALEVRVGDLPPQMPAAVELAALRIVQEAVTNVRRHARATACTVEVCADGARMTVVVTDDGVGLAPGTVEGIGLRSMRERAQELGGSAEVDTSASGGTRVTVSLPIREVATL